VRLYHHAVETEGLTRVVIRGRTAAASVGSNDSLAARVGTIDAIGLDAEVGARREIAP
jgi:hypothetical protein